MIAIGRKGFPKITVLRERALNGPGMSMRLQTMRYPEDEPELHVALFRNGQPAGGAFIKARHLPILAEASARCSENPPRVGVVGTIPVRSGVFEIGVTRAFAKGKWVGGVSILLVDLAGNRKTPTVLHGEADLIALDLAIDNLLEPAP